MDISSLERIYHRRSSMRRRDRLIRFLQPPAPFIVNPAEPKDFPLGRWNLNIGGAGRIASEYVNLDLARVPGVDVVANAEHLPFRSGTFQRVECDAVLEHAVKPEEILREIARTLGPGGYAHVVTPFCHPFHAYPNDYRRFTIDGLRSMTAGLEEVDAGWRTGRTATLLVFTLEYIKLLLPYRAWRAISHGLLGWMLFPLRYLDLLFFDSQRGGRIGNHCYLWLRKPLPPALGNVPLDSDKSQ